MTFTTKEELKVLLIVLKLPVLYMVYIYGCEATCVKEEEASKMASGGVVEEPELVNKSYFKRWMIRRSV